METSSPSAAANPSFAKLPTNLIFSSSFHRREKRAFPARIQQPCGTFVALAKLVKREMHPSYRLLDVGLEEKLERFGDYVVVRPAPAASGHRGVPREWAAFQARYDPQAGWEVHASLPNPWVVWANGIAHELGLGAGGQVGYFPEQEELRRRIAEKIGQRDRGEVDPLRVLNLFASTGGSTIAAARAGARVTHVDSQRAALRTARRHAEL